MTYLKDLSDYTNWKSSYRPKTKSVGWLDSGHEFPKATPREELLDLIWIYCRIRVFGKDGLIYAAPTLLYHYVSVHHYRPPDEFVRALNEGPRPPSQEYFERLQELGLRWNKTSAPNAKPPCVKFVRSPDGKIERIELP